MVLAVRLRLLVLLAVFISDVTVLLAATVSGYVRDKEGNALPYASVFVAGSSKGVSANSEGFYTLELPSGNYTLVGQYVGFARKEIRLQVGNDPVRLDILLEKQALTLPEIVISNKEDPAYFIIRETIKKQEENLLRQARFACQVYTKGQLRLRDYPVKFLAQKVDFEDGDSSKKKILFLSETVSAFSKDGKQHQKVEVISSRVSGNSDGFGLAAPDQYSLYENSVLVGTQLNPRGFISPLAAAALQFYRYKLLGSFQENGKTISQIRVIPKRKDEPLFSGEITLVEDDWQLYSVNLIITKQQQLELLDTLRLTQLYQKVGEDWMLNSQVLYPATKKLGFDVYGSFVNVYTEYNKNPVWPSRYFGRTVLKYTDSSNQRSLTYWEKVRPVPLQEDERKDYIKKDSLEKLRKDPHYMDSLNKVRNKFTVPKLLLSGQTLFARGENAELSVNAVKDQMSFNPAEGWVWQPQFSWFHKPDSKRQRNRLSGNLNFRYGFSNNHFSPSAGISYSFGHKLSRSISISAGKQVMQFNARSPITEMGNTLSCLLYERNRIKSYEANFIKTIFSAGIGSGFSGNITLQYEDRSPLENTTDYTWFNKKDRSYSPNYPDEIAAHNIIPHQTFSASIGLRFQPGARYIEFPDRTVNIGSGLPVFRLSVTRGFPKIGGSDADFSKWRADITDAINLKRWGLFRYRAGAGGFLSKKLVSLPDYNHFNGNNSSLATEYLNSFQLLSPYLFSNTEKIYWLAHVEYNLQGLLTNKIPVLKKTGCYLVTGFSASYVDAPRNHIEWFVGLDNLLKQLRVDYIRANRPGSPVQSGIRIGIRGSVFR